MWNIQLINRRETEAYAAPTIQDLNTGELIPIVSPSYFELETVLLCTAYYRMQNREHRFRLFEAREAGLKIEK